MILTLCFAAMVLNLGAFLDQTGVGGAPAWYGVWGGYFDGSSEPYHMTFRGVDQGGPAYRGGMREGDLVDVRRHTVLERVSLLGQPLAGRPLTFNVERGSERMTATVVPSSFSISRFWNYAVVEFASFWLLLFAVLIAWRRPYADNNLLLSTLLAFAAIGFNAETVFFAFPWTWAYVVLVVVSQALPLSVALWATLASSFARPLSAPRRVALGLCYTFVAIAVLVGDGTADRVIGLAPLIGMITLWFDPTAFLGAAWTIPPDIATFMALICSVLAIVEARGVDRQRAGWLLVPLAVYYGFASVTTLAFHVLSYSLILITAELFSVVALVTPLVLTYAALNRRLIDAGFVLNRTVVFAIVSTIVIGAFVLVEWAAGAWFVNASHTTSVVVGMVVALALGLSLRYIHKYVDGFVDRVLFRQRHEDEAALRRFAHESAYINDTATLLGRAVATVRRHTTAESADIFVRNGTTAYASTSDGNALSVSQNDPAIVALSAWGEPVDLHGITDSKLPGELAFPMISRGRLVGALVCGPKRDGETYAPDESDALLALAHGVGGALDVLGAQADGSSGSAIGELRESIRALSEATRSLPDAIAARLREGAAQP